MKHDDRMAVHTERISDGVVLRPVGEIDLSRAPSLREQISQVQRDGPGRLVIDLSEVPYMDSSGVATLVEAMQIARRQNHKLILCCPQDKVRAVFEIARLDTVFKIVADKQTALTM